MKRNSHIAFSAGDKFRRFSFALCCSGPIACLLVLMALLLATPTSFAVAPGTGSVPFRFVHGFAVVVPVSVNGQGPYDFMLDTGSTITTLDSGLGQQLGLATQGMGTVTTLTQSAPAPLAVASRVAIGPVTEENLVVMIRDLNGLHQIAPTARGVLGQNALDHTDFLLDYKHKLIQFDIDGEIGRSLGGRHVPLHREMVGNNSKYANLSVHGSVNDNGVREMELLLDSGSASLVLFAGVDSVGTGYAESFVADTAGHHLLAGIRDLQLVIDGKSREVPTHVLSMKKGGGPKIDGLLPTSIFNRIYISNRGGFAMFEPKQLKSSALSGAVASLPSQGTAAHGGGF